MCLNTCKYTRYIMWVAQLGKVQQKCISILHPTTPMSYEAIIMRKEIICILFPGVGWYTGPSLSMFLCVTWLCHNMMGTIATHKHATINISPQHCHNIKLCFLHTSMLTMAVVQSIISSNNRYSQWQSDSTGHSLVGGGATNGLPDTLLWC